MISVAEARRLIDAALTALPVETVPLSAAHGRVLAGDVVADRDFPAADRSAMDGFAVRSADLASPATLRVVGEIPAGTAPAGIRVGAGEACRIFTGASLPAGADAVVMVERTSEDRAAGTVRIEDTPAPGQHVRRRAQDLAAGATVLQAGAPIRAAEIAALASVGCCDVPVFESPSVAVLSTGDELVPPAGDPSPHQIRDSNAAMLVAQVDESGFHARDLGHAGDDAAVLEAKLAEGLRSRLLLVTGGVSVGEYDLVARALEEAGAEKLFHGVAMKPGKPIFAARTAEGLALGLPGNPLSAFVGFMLFGAPALRRMAGQARPWPDLEPVTLAAPLRKRPGRETYHLAHVAVRDGERIATPVPSTGSGDVLAIARANALVVTVAGADGAAAGERLDALMF